MPSKLFGTLTENRNHFMILFAEARTGTALIGSAEFFGLKPESRF